MNYNFVPLSILNLFKETHSKIKKLQIEETIVSHLGTAPNKTSSKFKKNDYREKSSQLCHYNSCNYRYSDFLLVDSSFNVFY